MTVLRPKYSLNKKGVEGSVITVPANAYTYATGRRYPYLTPGTRDPGYPYPATNPGKSPRARVGGYRGNPGHNPGNPGTLMKPKFTLDTTETQGVMPIETYERITGKITTEPDAPKIVLDNGVHEIQYPSSLLFKPPSLRGPTMPVRAPTLAFDWGSFAGGAIAGGILTILLAYGVIPALAQRGARRIRGR